MLNGGAFKYRQTKSRTGVIRGYVRDRNKLLQSYLQAAVYQQAQGVLLWQVVPGGGELGPYDVTYNNPEGGPALRQLLDWNAQLVR